MTATAPGGRGLVYDDDSVCRRAVGAILARCGFTVIGEVSKAVDALRLAESEQPDVIVLDLALSGSRGIGILPALLAVAPRCALVVLSPFEALKEPALEAGACGFIDKRDMRNLEACLRDVAAAARPDPVVELRTVDLAVHPSPPADPEAPTGKPNGSRSKNALSS